MRILYVSSLWSGLPPLLFQGASESNGMPAFLEPLQFLVKQGHTVRVVFLCKRPVPEFNTGAAWLASTEPRFVDRSQARLPGGKRRIIRTAARREMADFRPDVVYLHGTSAAPLWRLAERMGIPCGQRVYGVDNFVKEFPRAPRWWIRLRKPCTWHAFNGRKAFVIATRDGSRADLALAKLNPDPAFTFHYLVNGFVPGTDADPPALETVAANQPYLFCPARFSYMKAKFRTVHLLQAMREKGWNELQLVVAGQRLHDDEDRKSVV